jgi:Rieske Fe-S protein
LKYDLAGRVFKDMPAPCNLLVLPNKYLSATHQRISEDAG